MNNKKLFEQRYKEIMNDVARTVKSLLVNEGLDVNPTVVNKTAKLDEMARAAVKRTIDKKAYANVADAIRRHNYDIEWAKTVSPNPRWDDAELLHRYVSALMCLKQPCPQTEADIDKIGVFAEYAKTLIDDDHTGSIEDIITLFNEQDPIEARGNRVGTARAAKGWRKTATDTTETPTSTPAPAEKPVSQETEEVPASEFKFDDEDDEETTTTPAEEPVDNDEDNADFTDDDTTDTDEDYPSYDDADNDSDSNDDFDDTFEDDEDETDFADDDTDDALDNDSEDGEYSEDDEDMFDDDDMFDDAFGDSTPSRPAKRQTKTSSIVTDDALDNDSEDGDDDEDETDDDNMFDDNEDFFDGDDSEPASGRDDTVWGHESSNTDSENDEEEEDEDPNRITNIKAVTLEQYDDPNMIEAFHNFAPSKILLEDGKVGFKFRIKEDLDDDYIECSIMRDTFGKALEDYRVINDATMDANLGDMFLWLEVPPVIRTFWKTYSNIISEDDDREDEISARVEEFAETCLYKAKNAQDIVDFINKEFNAE